jgi:hypothetical protein
LRPMGKDRNFRPTVPRRMTLFDSHDEH